MEQRQSCVARLLDVRSFILAARLAVARVDGGTAVVMILIFGFIGLCLAPIWVGFDLQSTWAWANGVQTGAQGTIDSMAQKTDALVGGGQIVMNMTLGQLLGAAVVVGITLLPSLFELGFPSVQHPLLMLLLWAAILFDYVTDWPTSWALTAGWAGSETALIHFVWAVLWNLFVSVGVQALLVICATVVIFGFLRLARGAAPAVTGQAVIVSK